MGIFDRLFGKKSKSSEVKDANREKREQITTKKNTNKKIITREKSEKQKETDNLKLRISANISQLSLVEEKQLEKHRKWIIAITKQHPMFSGSTSDVIEFVTNMVSQTENYILSCEGITNVEKGFLIWNNTALEIQYDQHWQDGDSVIYKEFVLRTGDDQFEVFGSEKSAARMATVWGKIKAKNGNKKKPKEIFKPNVKKLLEKEDVAGLIKTLEYKDDDVRREAIDALFDIINWTGTKDKRAVEPLIRALKDEDGNVRQKAAATLGIIRDKRAVEPLTQALEDEDSGVRWVARKSLEMIKKT